MKRFVVPGIGMRIIKTAVAVMLSYAVFALFDLVYREEYGGVWGQLGPLYACVACIVCTQSTLGQTARQGISRLIGVAVGGVLGALVLFLGPMLEITPVRILMLGIVCVAGVWFCLLIQRPAACSMACIVPCIILIFEITGPERYYYAAARVIETAVGVLIALLVNAVLPDHRPDGNGTEQKGADGPVMLKNTVKKLCVIGDPVLHSKSPLIQNTMIETLGLDYIYLCQPVTKGECAKWLECAKFAGYAGFNATMPHKQELLPLMDELDEDARLYGAVNTVCIRDGKTYGYNTDGRGFLASLEYAGIDTVGKTVLVLGAGGAARAVAPKLCQAGRAAKVYVANRTVEKAAELCRSGPAGVMEPAGFDIETLRRLAAQADLVVNCTNLGMTGTEGQFEDLSFLDALKPGAAVCDLIYSPAETLLLREARLRGHRTLNGLGMLIWQAIFALEHFTGERIDGEAVLEPVKKALEQA